MDEKATREVEQLSGEKSQEEIRREALAAEAKRSERFREHFERLATLSLYLTWTAITAVACVWLCHLLTPEAYHWLSESQVEQIQAVLTGGVVAGVAVGHLRKKLYD